MSMVLNGKGVSEGVAMAALRLYIKKLPEIPTAPAADVEQEEAHLTQILNTAQQELQALYEASLEKLGKEEAGIFDAHLTMLSDEYSVCEPIRDLIRGEGLNVAAAICKQFDLLIELFRSMDDELLSERAADVGDLKDLLLRIALGMPRQDLSRLDADVIVVAEELTPSDTVRMDTKHIKGIVTRLGGVTAHSAIIARTLGIPAVTGISACDDLSLDGKTAIIDGTSGQVSVEPDAEELRRFRAAQEAADAAERELEAYRHAPSVTKDGVRLEICGNIGTPAEAADAVALGADGVGLFRSEFLFMDREALPSEEEQFEAYRTALDAMDGRPLIVRTLDVGGDKKLPALPLPQEDNPFLGYRAIRMTLKQPEVFRPQLRALLRASAYGDLRVMFPMISRLEELREAKAMLAREREDLQAAGIAVGKLPVGIMVEIPAAAILADRFAAEVDFFSIGTNDLTQYTLAVERGNEKVAELYTPEHPAVLHLIATTASAAVKHGIVCGMCGEAAADPRLAPAFVGMGLMELSMSPRRIAQVRKQLSGMTMDECRRCAAELLG